MEEGKIVSTYHGDNDLSHHTAYIIKEEDGYYVHCWAYGAVSFIINCTAHSLCYAEDAAENWVLGVGSWT